MTGMVEKVAKALIVARFGEEGLLIFGDVPDGFDKSKEATALFAKRISEARAEARAAVMAMEPDNSMKSAGSRTEVCHAWGKNGEFITAESAGDVFSDMIRDALNEGRISEISEDICEVASGLALDASTADSFFTLAARGMAVERDRCISIAQSIEPHNEAEAHLIETIVRRMRGEE